MNSMSYSAPPTISRIHWGLLKKMCRLKLMGKSPSFFYLAFRPIPSHLSLFSYPYRQTSLLRTFAKRYQMKVAIPMIFPIFNAPKYRPSKLLLASIKAKNSSLLRTKQPDHAGNLRPFLSAINATATGLPLMETV